MSSDGLDPWGDDWLQVYDGLTIEAVGQLEELGWDMALPPRAEPVDETPELEFINHEERPEVTINEDDKEDAYWVVEGSVVYPLEMMR